ncbi:MAG TPA: hypothetical protein VG326_11155, partial [Tepidisphaeraceae bacterium]|nr:hypothetical protein [Tepidisphaeraceae bacterium]
MTALSKIPSAASDEAEQMTTVATMKKAAIDKKRSSDRMGSLRKNSRSTEIKISRRGAVAGTKTVSRQAVRGSFCIRANIAPRRGERHRAKRARY